MKLLLTCIFLSEITTTLYGKTIYADSDYADGALPPEDADSKVVFDDVGNRKPYEAPGIRRPYSRDKEDRSVRGDVGRRITYGDDVKVNYDRRTYDKRGDEETDDKIFYEDPYKKTSFKDNDKDFNGDAGYGTPLDTSCDKKPKEEPGATIYQVSYRDLEKLNVDCYPRDSCMRKRTNDSPGITDYYTCSCDKQCFKYGTCCVDSPDGDKSPLPRHCVAVDSSAETAGYYMVHRCPSSADKNLVWKSECEDDRYGEDNILKIAPVTSLDTNTTYKNYYCFRCHEDINNFLYWELLLQSDNEMPEGKDFVTYYDEVEKKWYAKSLSTDISMPVKIKFMVPKGDDISVECNQKVISDCPDSWRDKSVRDKCHAYTALLYRRDDVVYKNAHCALCNSQILDQLSCEKPTRSGSEFEEPETTLKDLSKVNLARLIDINFRHNGKIGRRQRCDGSHVWDPFGQKCRKLACIRRDHVVKDGKCSPR